MYDGLSTASGMFVDYTIARFEEVKQLHIILLVVTLVLVVAFVAKMWAPYVRKLHVESRALAGMMSLLPAEVDIESHVKSLVLGLNKDRGASNSMRSASMAGGAMMTNSAAMRWGAAPGAGMLPGPHPGMRLLPPPGAAGGGMTIMAMDSGGGGGGGWGAPGGGGGPRGAPHWD
jgi:hypothetical protein